MDKTISFKQILSAEENVEEILHLVRNQEKDINEDIMYENIVLKKAFLKPLEAPLPSIPKVFTRKKSNSCPDYTAVTSWNGRKRADSDVFFDTTHNEFLSDKHIHDRRGRAVSLPPLGCEQAYQRPNCPTPSSLQKR